MGILKEFEKIKKETDKLQAMLEDGEEEYAKTHSNCCDAQIDKLNGSCAECLEHCVSQYEVGE